MDQDQKLDLIISELASLKAAVVALPGPTTPPVPSPEGGLYDFVRPAERDVSPFAGIEMRTADAEEAFLRAVHGVNWRGGYIGDAAYDEAWTEIEALKAGDRALIGLYRTLDPAFAGFALLCGYIQPAKYDGITFGVNAGVRRGFAGTTVQSFMNDQFAVGGTPGGDDAG